jgi:8-oxo-dGTP pyrophosphatase MutT (NUDIX family)
MNKRCTYAFEMFVYGKYNSSDSAAIIAVLSGTTIDEKHDILSMNFMQIWYRLNLNSPRRTANFHFARNKFDTTFGQDEGKRLRDLVSKAGHARRVWEIPKGRKLNKAEPDIHCAVREFREETGIDKRHYRIFPGATRSYSHDDMGTKYTNTYFLAVVDRAAEPRIDFSLQDQATEVGDLRWMNIETIRCMDDTGRLEPFVRPIFSYIRRHK